MNYRLILKGFLAVLLGGVTFLLLLEIGLRITGYGKNNLNVDFFNGFEGSGRAFIEKTGEDGIRVYTAVTNRPLIPQSFPVLKKPKTFRIFTFGGSTTEGVPWGPKGSFASWLEQGLLSTYPNWNIEVISCGVSGYGSSRVLVLLKEMVHYDADLFIVYTGQNEFRDSLFHYDELNRTAFEVSLLKWGFLTRVISLLYERFLVVGERIFGPRTRSYAVEEIKKILSRPFDKHTFVSFDYYRVPSLTSSKSKDEPQWKAFAKWLLRGQRMNDEEVYKRFSTNILEMINVAKRYEVKIVFLGKAQNPMAVSAQKNYAVFHTNLRKSSTVEQWKQLYGSAVMALQGGNCKRAIQYLEGIKDLYKEGKDIEDSLLHLYLGECYAKLGDFERAKVELGKRLTVQHRTLNIILKEHVTQNGVSYIDVEDLFSRHTREEVIGYKNFFVDNAHMTVKGYQLIGNYLRNFIAEKHYINAIPIAIFSNSGRSQEVNVDVSIENSFDTATVHTSLGWSAFNQGKVEEAVKHGRKAVAMKSDEIQAHLLLGYAYKKMNRLEEAHKEWNAIRDLWGGKKA